jgi:hypothetical protein
MAALDGSMVTTTDLSKDDEVPPTATHFDDVGQVMSFNHEFGCVDTSSTLVPTTRARYPPDPSLPLTRQVLGPVHATPRAFAAPESPGMTMTGPGTRSLMGMTPTVAPLVTPK